MLAPIIWRQTEVFAATRDAARSRCSSDAARPGQKTPLTRTFATAPTLSPEQPRIPIKRAKHSSLLVLRSQWGYGRACSSSNAPSLAPRRRAAFVGFSVELGLRPTTSHGTQHASYLFSPRMWRHGSRRGSAVLLESRGASGRAARLEPNERVHERRAELCGGGAS